MFRAKRVLSFILGASSFAVYGQQAKSPVAAVETLIRSHEYDQAFHLAQSSLRKTPEDFRLWTLEGIVFSIQGSNHEALAAFDKALKLSPDYPAALRGEVSILYQAGDTRAVPLLERILRVDPTDETANEMLAVLSRKRGDCQAAINHFRLASEAIQSHPESLEAYGDCLVRAKQWQAAAPVFEQLASLLPQRAYPKYDLAVVLIGTKQNDAAIKILEPLLSAEPPDPDTLSLASEAYEAVGDTPKAVSLLRRAIVIDPTNPNYYVAFASICLSHSSFQVGIDMMNAGLQRIHSDPSLYIARGVLYAQLAQYDKAASDFNAAEQLDSKQDISAFARDLTEIQRNQNGKALQNIRAQLRAHPQDAILHYTLARLIDDEGDKNPKTSDEAIREAQQALKLKPDLVDARDLITRIYMRSGNYGPAIEQCRLALQSDPTDQSAIYHLIIALQRTGRGTEKDEVQQLVKQLSNLKQSTLQQETKRNRYQLVEQPGPK